MSSPAQTMTPEHLRRLLQPFTSDLTPALAGQLCLYLELLLRWNGRTNLTAIRDPESIVERHFGESLFTARHLPPGGGTLLDLGSGAGFPGLPIALACPDWQVTLAESQGKKTAFLQEACRVLGAPAEVWPRRVELLPAGRCFRVVTLRAVDQSQAALAQAAVRVSQGGAIFHLTSGDAATPAEIAMPGGHRRVLRIIRQQPE